MPNKDCVDKWYEKRFVVYALAVGIVIVGLFAVFI